MSWFSQVTGRSTGPDSAEAQAAAQARVQQWEVAMARGQVPQFVADRLTQAASGAIPWMATMTAAELLLARSHGVRPIATVTGTCWFHYGRSWTEGHASGWRQAQSRMVAEAVTAEANAIVDVRMRTINHRMGDSMDFTMMGTAVRIDGLPASANPIVVTTPALEFVRLLEMGIVPTGLAIGAQFDTISGNLTGMPVTNYGNGEHLQLARFCNRVRSSAHAELRNDARRQGGGVLAHTQFGQLLRFERDKQPPLFLGRHIVMGTVVDAPRGSKIPHHIQTVIDMRDDQSPLTTPGDGRHFAYGHNEHEGPI